MRGYIIVGMIWTNIFVSVFVLVELLYFLKLEHNTHIGVSLEKLIGVC